MPQGDWDVDPSSLSLPPFAGPNDPSIFLGPDVPLRVQQAINDYAGGAGILTAVAVVLYKRSDTLYWFDALVTGTFASQLDVGVMRGIIDSTLDAITEVHRWRNITGLGSVELGNGGAAVGADRVLIGTPSHGLESLLYSVIPPRVNLRSSGNMFLQAETAPAFTITATAGESSATSSMVLTQTLAQLINKGLQINAAGSAITIGGRNDIMIDGRTAPRAMTAFAASQADTGAVGVGFANVLNTAFQTIRAGRAYQVEIGGNAFMSAATNTIEFYINVDIAGVGENTYWIAGGFGPSGAAPPVATANHTIMLASNTRSASFKVYIRASAGTVNWRGNAIYPRFIRVHDVGASVDYGGGTVLP